MAGTGFESPPQNAGKLAIAYRSGAESGALGTDDGRFDIDLAAVVDAWPTLPDAIKEGILAMIRVAT
jgi:hypothetical protein